MAEKKTIDTLISLAVICLIVAALIGSLASESQNRTTKTSVKNELITLIPNVDTNLINSTAVYTVKNNPTSWKTEDCPLINFAVKNASDGTALTLTTHYVPTLSEGTFTLVNIAPLNTTYHMNTSNKAYVDYDYCGDGYLNSSWGRSLLNMAPGFLALALLVAVIAGAYYLLERKKEDD